MKINPSVLLNIGHVEDAERTFQSRSFLIRYKDELHELNDGCHWRLTLNKVLIVDNKTQPPSYSLANLHDLCLKFKLYVSPYYEIENQIDDELPSSSPSSSSKSNSPNEEPTWTVVAEQTLQIQNIINGVHEYFPVCCRCCYLYILPIFL